MTCILCMTSAVYFPFLFYGPYAEFLKKELKVKEDKGDLNACRTYEIEVGVGMSGI